MHDMMSEISVTQLVMSPSYCAHSDSLFWCRVFAVNDSGSSMHLVDRDGQVLLTLKSKFFSAHNKWYIYSGRGTDKENKIATVKPQSGTTSAEVSLGSTQPCYDCLHMSCCLTLACSLQVPSLQVE